MTQQAQMSQNPNAEKVVRKYFGAYLACDPATIESAMAEDFHFTSPVNNRIGRKTCFEHFRRLGLVALLVLAWCNVVLSHAPAQGKKSPAATGLAKEFASQTVTVNGITLHYVRGGEGPPIILIHGFPQAWFEYQTIIPRLAKRFTVIAVDLRGVGGSTATPGSYDAVNMAEDVYQLASTLKLEHVYIIGHDIGGMVTYAFVRRYPQATRGAMILDTPIPGIEGWDEIQGDPSVWHIRLCKFRASPRNLSPAGRPIISATSSTSANLRRAKRPIM
jgi:hypothetical protein